MSKHKRFKIYDPGPRRHRLPDGTPKVGYRTEYVAAAAAELRGKGRDLEAYECPQCGLWHFGNRPKHLLFNEQDLLEHGPRVEALLRMENTRDQTRRVNKIRERFRGVRKRGRLCA